MNSENDQTKEKQKSSLPPEQELQVFPDSANDRKVIILTGYLDAGLDGDWLRVKKSILLTGGKNPPQYAIIEEYGFYKPWSFRLRNKPALKIE